LLAELDMLRAQGYHLAGRFFVSSRAPLVMPWHRLLDVWSEERRGERKIGTTGKGIGPAYEDKIGREGMRVGDLLDPERITRLAGHAIAGINELAEGIYHRERLESEDMLAQIAAWAEALRPYITDTTHLLHDAVNTGKKILFEGAQGTMLDIDHGTFPFVTSSNTSIGGVCVGTGLPPRVLDGVLGIAKAYCTRVGEGPFPSEDFGGPGQRLRDAGGEYGSVTGRPRRCGWFDAVAARYAAAINGLDAVALMKLDVLDGFEDIHVCVAYELDGRIIEQVPDSAEVYARCKPVYETVPGWRGTTAGVRAFADLPKAAQEFVDHLAAHIGVPVALVSTGRDRSHTIIREEILREKLGILPPSV
jgi:adenylosuccinate synthase